jgi:4-amino-4-deoxy-L-arabinose transferase-like glycosyltransferase
MTRALRWIAISALAIGLVVRTVPLVLNPAAPLTTCDGRAYHTLALNLAAGRGLNFDDPVTVAQCGDHLKLGPSHHYAPGLAFVEAPFIVLLGDTALALVLPLLLLSWGAVAVVWLTTRDLFGRDAALLASAAVSLEWTGALFGAWNGYAENLVIITFTLTMWAILRALTNDRFLVLAGLFAGAGYLSKASLGWFFLIAGLGGFVWRLLYRGVGVLKNRWYWAAVGVFGVIFGLWALRNLNLFWDGTPTGLLDAWQTSDVQAKYVAAAFGQKSQLAIGLAGKLPILAIGLVLPFLPLLRGFRQSLQEWKREDVSGLWLAVGLVFVLGWFFAGAFWVTERTNLLWADAIRYVMPAQIPLLWLLLRDGQPQRTRPWALSFLIMLVTTIAATYLLADGALLGRNGFVSP